MVGGGHSLKCGKSKDLLCVKFDFSIQIITKVVHISENDKGHHSQPFNSQIKFVILLTVNHTILLMLVLRIFGSTNYPQIDIFLDSRHSSRWFCIDIARRNYVLVTLGS